jgi:hypothetical protein
MTRRILLTLADDTTVTKCRGCRFLSLGKCLTFGMRLEIDPDGDTQYDVLRAHACINAEAAADRLVDVHPADAARVTVSNTRLPVGDPEAYRAAKDARRRVTVALREHGKRAK